MAVSVERQPFSKTFDHDALTGRIHFGGAEIGHSTNTAAAVNFWMNYAWSAFCLQWVAISWCAVIGTATPGAEGGR